MNGKERITAVLEGRPTDRVPNNLLFYQGYIARCAGAAQWQFEYGSAEDQFAMVTACARRHPDNDGIWTQTGMNRYPVLDMHVEMINGEPWAIFDNGQRKQLTDDPANSQWNRTPAEEQRKYESNRVRAIDEIGARLGPVVPASQLLVDPSHGNLARLAREIGRETFLWVNFSSLFATALGYLGGPEEGWLASATDPTLVEAVLERCMRQHIEFIDAAAAAGGHGLWACFMLEGANIISPEIWRGLVKPYVVLLVKRAHLHGLKFVAWFLDDCRPLVKDLIEIGVDGISTEPSRGAYQCEPGDLRRLAGERLCLFSWFRERDLLAGDGDAIRQTLWKQYREAGDGRPFAVATPGLTQEVDAAVVDMVLEESRRLS